MSQPSLTLSWSGHHTESLELNGESVDSAGTRTITLPPGQHTITLSVTVPQPDVPPPTPHPDDPAKRDEHLAMLALVPTVEATHTVVKSGKWSDAATWSAGVPTVGAKVVVPAGKSLTLDTMTADLKWLRIDGELHGDPAKAVELRAVTVVCTPSGLFEFGTEAAPQTGQVTILDRGLRDKVADPFDMSGGVIIHGKTMVVGESKTAWAAPATVPQKGDDTLVLDAAPIGWAVGDQLLVSGTSIDNIASASERRTIKAITGAVVTLDAPLEHQHGGTRYYPSAFPVANLSRSIVFMSANQADITRRGHVMQMHSAAAMFSGAAFVGLGRTDAERIHTNDPDGDNQMGRYAGPHLHIVSGATRDSAPMIVRGCVVDGGPKHGIVSHGAHALIEDNVVVGLKGSGIFHENGSEIGITRRNLAVDCISTNALHFVDDNRQATATAPSDFGADGVGIWLQGQNVDVTDNYTLGCGTGIEAFTRFIGGTAPPEIPVSNLRPEQREAVALGRASVPIEQVPGYYARNTILGGRTGMSFWSLHLFSRHTSTPVTNGNQAMPVTAGVQTVIEDTLIVGQPQGIAATYTRFLTLRNSHLVGLATPFGWAQPSSVPIHQNEVSAAFVFENCRFEHYDYPLVVPTQGACVVRDCYADFDKGGLVVTAESADPFRIPRTVTISGMTWGPRTVKSGNLIKE